MVSVLVANLHTTGDSSLSSERLYSASTIAKDRQLHTAFLKNFTKHHPYNQYAAQNIYTERSLGETETSYFLPSRESGVNDMYVLVTIQKEGFRFT